MRIAINIEGLAGGGGKTIGLNLLSYVDRLNVGAEVCAWVPDEAEYQTSESGSIVERRYCSRRSGSIWEFVRARRRIKKAIAAFQPDCILSLGNVGLDIGVKELVLVMWPYLASDEAEVWSRLELPGLIYRRLKKAYVKSTLRKADVIVAQTNWMRRGLRGELPPSCRIVRIPPGRPENHLTQSDRDDEGEVRRKYQLPDNNVLLVLSRYYPHKNLEVLFDVADIAVKGECKYQIVTTIEPSQNDGAEGFVHRLENRPTSAQLRNIGHIPVEEVPALLRSVDGLLLPTLLESFSHAYIDAMVAQIPIFTSDRGFAREVCGRAAHYFNPHSAKDIHESIIEGLSRKSELVEKRRAGWSRLRELPSWESVMEEYIRLVTAEVE